MPSIKRNYLCNLIHQMISVIVPFITTPYISRVFGAYNIGIYSYTNSVLAYFLLFAALGTAFYGKREIARCRDNVQRLSETFWEIFLLSLCSTTVCALGWIIFIIIQNSFTIYYCILTIQIIAIPLDVTWFFEGIERFDKILIRNSIVKAVSVCLIFLLIKNTDDLWKYMLIVSCSALLGNISMWLYLKEYLVKVKVDYRRIRNHYGQTLIYFLPTIATTVYTVLDRTMLQVFTRDLNENGYYEQAVKICNIPMYFILALDAVMGSRMTYLIEKNGDTEIKVRLVRSLSFVALLGIPMVLGINAIVRQFVPWFLGNGFEGTVRLVWIYSPLILCVAINNFLGEQYLTPIGKRSKTAIIVLFSAILNFFLNLLIIPRYHAQGAALTSVVSEGFIAISYMIMCRNVLPFKIYRECFSKKMISGIFMFVCVIVTTSKWEACIFTTVIQLLIGCVSYVIMLVLLRDAFVKELIVAMLCRRKEYE